MTELLQTSLSENEALVFAVALFFSATSGQKMEALHRVTLIYSYCLIIGYFEIISFESVALGSGIVLFLVFEVFSSDQMLLHLFCFGYKLGDAFFKLVFEYYGWLFYPLLWFFAESSYKGNMLIQLLFFLAVVYLATLTSRARFSVVPMSQLINRLESLRGRPGMHVFSQEDRRKLDLLVFMEDGNFYARSERVHVITLRYAFSRIVMRLKRGGIAQIEQLARNISSLRRYIRGYSTIEMQILRNAGLQFGSDCLVIRRKVFEYFYSQAVFNSYTEQFLEGSPERAQIKDWILRCYLCLVSVKVGDTICCPASEKTTFDLLFKKPFSELSLEEFFVWCLGLPHYRLGVGDNAVRIHSDVVERFHLDPEAIKEAIIVARNASK